MGGLRAERRGSPLVAPAATCARWAWHRRCAATGDIVAGAAHGGLCRGRGRAAAPRLQHELDAILEGKHPDEEGVHGRTAGTRRHTAAGAVWAQGQGGRRRRQLQGQTLRRSIGGLLASRAMWASVARGAADASGHIEHRARLACATSPLHVCVCVCAACVEGRSFRRPRGGNVAGTSIGQAVP